MNFADNDTLLIDGYMGLLDNLSTTNKLDLISKLTTSINADLSIKQQLFREAFGAFKSEKSAEEIIDDVRSSRVFNREIESF